RCQALAIVGDAAATDPSCELSPHHARMAALAEESAARTDARYAYRGRGEREAVFGSRRPTPIPVR
ncbi:MAG TPA: hypothetical protein VN702_24095, partial [Acetobacteraceae bacterium]|nr:hypothetical protein [Acetobacteraceae bacterium]